MKNNVSIERNKHIEKTNYAIIYCQSCNRHTIRLSKKNILHGKKCEARNKTIMMNTRRIKKEREKGDNRPNYLDLL